MDSRGLRLALPFPHPSDSAFGNHGTAIFGTLFRVPARTCLSGAIATAGNALIALLLLFSAGDTAIATVLAPHQGGRRALGPPVLLGDSNGGARGLVLGAAVTRHATQTQLLSLVTPVT